MTLKWAYQCVIFQQMIIIFSYLRKSYEWEQNDYYLDLLTLP